VDSCVFLIFTTKVDPTLGSTFFKLILFEKSREELEFVSLIRKHLGNSGRFSEDGDFMENAVSPLLKIYSVREALNLAERETLLYRLGSELNRTVFNSCGNPIIRGRKHVSFQAARFFKESILNSTPKKKPKKEVDYFWKHQTSNSRLRHSI